LVRILMLSRDADRPAVPFDSPHADADGRGSGGHPAIRADSPGISLAESEWCLI
jgi:hypothetical protein